MEDFREVFRRYIPAAELQALRAECRKEGAEGKAEG
jgi:hypothetical protein